MKVYLAGAINGCTDQQCKDWRAQAKEKLPDCADPMDRDYRGVEDFHAADIVENDKNDINNSDVLLVMYERPSVGTSMEVLYAWEAEKHVVIVNNSGQTLSPWLIYHSHQIFRTLDTALQYLLAHPL